MTVELTQDQMKMAETELKGYLPKSLQVYGYLVLKNRVTSDPARVFVDKWPHFNVIICKPHIEQESDLFRDTVVFANNQAILEQTIRKSSVVDWSRYLCLGASLVNMEIFKAVASESDVPYKQLAACHMMILEDVSKLPSLDSSKISLSSLDISHLGLVNQMWKFGEDAASGMICNMITNFPSCCVLDAEGKPVSWILTYPSCAIGMLYTVPEHRGKGYAKILICTLARKHYAQGYPVYCFIEEENMVSYSIFKNLGFTEVPSHREVWFEFNDYYISR
ncbi:glycine N-acyltransferase [Pholidichthys leucotaenia]